MQSKDDWRLKREAAANRRLAAEATPGLPVDADVHARRAPVVRIDSLLKAACDALLADPPNPFFETVRDRWSALFPDVAARPRRLADNRLFVGVASSGRLFALRPKVRAMERALRALDGAPKNLKVLLEIA